jgi:hypothetical protein
MQETIKKLAEELSNEIDRDILEMLTNKSKS